MERNQFKENVILVDVAFIDGFADMVRTHFSKEMGRELPLGAIADFLVCAAITAGIPQCEAGEAAQEVQVILVCGKEDEAFKSYFPVKLADIDGHAFMSKKHGEFQISVVRDEKLYEDAEPLMMESAKLLMDEKAVKRLAVVTHPDDYEAMSELAAKVDGKEVNLLVVPPSLAKDPAETQRIMQIVMYAMALRSEELEKKFAFAFDYGTGQEK